MEFSQRTGTSIPQNGESEKCSFEVPGWFCDQVSWIRDPVGSNSAAYNLPLCLHIEGALNYDALKWSLQQVQRNHQPLRSVFGLRAGRLVQTVLPEGDVPLTITELTRRGTNVPLSDLQKIAADEASRPFDLAQHPAFRASLLRSGDEHELVLTTHELVCDDWSAGILLHEIFALYEDRLLGRNTAAGVRDFQYADFVRWQQNRLQGRVLQSRLNFWKQRLSADSGFHHLSPDRARLPFRTYRGEVQRTPLPDNLRSALVQLSRCERVSLFMVMLAAFQCVLHRSSGEGDIAIGSCTANRNLTQVEGLVGRFGNALVIRTEVSGNKTFRELLARVRNDALTAYSHADVPFAAVVQEVQPHPDPSRNPLFQVMIIMKEALKRVDCRTLAVSPTSLDLGTSKYDLCVFLDMQNGLELIFEYNSDLYQSSTISELMCQYQATLEEMVRDPNARISAGLRSTVPHIGKPGPASSSSPVHNPAQDEMESKLVSIWEHDFGFRPISPDDNFFELGGNSLLAARLFAEIARIFKVDLPIVRLIDAPTIRQLANVIRHSASEHNSTLLVKIQSGEGSRPLFCIHGESGNLLFYRALARHLGPNYPVYGLQPQGLDGKQSPLTTIEEMAAIYVREIQSVQLHGPYFLAGYCMGGSLALEIAQQFCRKGEDVGLVALLDSYNFKYMRQSLADNLVFNLQKIWFGWRHFLRANPSTRRSFLERRRVFPTSHSVELSECNRRAALSYSAKAYTGRVLHIHSRHQYTRYARPELQWNGLLDGRDTLILPIFPGEMFEEPFVKILAAKLRVCIDQAIDQHESKWSNSTNENDWESSSGSAPHKE